MARKFLVAIDLGTNELQNAVIQNLAAASEPTGVKGRIYFDSTNNVIKVYNGTSWKALATGGEAATTVTLTGDVTGTGNVTGGTISVEATVGDDTHNHTTSTLTGIQEFVEDTASTMITAATHSGISVSYTDNGSGAGTLAFTNTDKGSSQDIFKTISVSGQSDVVADSNTDTLTIAGSTGLTVTTNATTDTITFTNSGVTSATGTPNEITVGGTGSDPYTGAITIGLPDDVTITGSLKVGGDLDIVGAINSFATATINVEDNTFLLNSNATGTPVVNAGIEVERGDYTNASIYWNETANLWYVGTPADNSDAAVVTALSLSGHTHATSDITGIQEYIEDTVGTMASGSNSLSVTYTDNAGSAGTLAIDTTLATTSYLSKSSGLAVDVSTLESKLRTDGFTKKYAANNTAITVSGGVATWVVSHGLGADVIVQMREVSSGAIVESNVVIGSTTATITWNSATNIDADTYRVVVTG
jgi:hypothetical protein